MKRFLMIVLAVFLLGVFSGCDRAEDVIENKIDTIEENLEQKVNDAANALVPPDAAGNFTPVDPSQLISPEEALNYATEDTLLVILDTHRENMLPCPELLRVVNKVIIIDHHRRSTDFITPVSLTYHEPFASSTCEMVTEILQHIGDVRKISELESQALYMGILLDTKNFVIKTGIRTFEAASYLKRCGLNTVEIKKLFNIDHEEYIQRLDIIKSSEVYRGGMAIAVSDKIYPNMRVIASQAADEMMNISGVKATFVLYPLETGISISARSYGDVNVQVIMEKLGGGGHAIVAGAQLRDVSPEDAANKLKTAIDEYLKENE